MEPHFHPRRNLGSEEPSDREEYSKIYAVQGMCEKVQSLTQHSVLARNRPEEPTSCVNGQPIAPIASQHQARGDREPMKNTKNSSSASGHCHSCKLLNTCGCALSLSFLDLSPKTVEV